MIWETVASFFVLTFFVSSLFAWAMSKNVDRILSGDNTIRSMAVIGLIFVGTIAFLVSAFLLLP